METLLATPCSLYFIGVHSLCTRPNVVYTSINSRKIKFVAYIYIYFSAEFYEKSGIRNKTEPEKHLHTVLLQTAEQHHWCHDVADIQSDCR